MYWLDLLAVQGTLNSLLQHHSSKASILRHSGFFIIQLSHPYMTTGKTIVLTRWIFVGKVMFLVFNMLSRLKTKGQVQSPIPTACCDITNAAGSLASTLGRRQEGECTQLAKKVPGDYFLQTRIKP